MAEKKKQRRLKEYEIDVNVIDLEAYVAYYINQYFPLTFSDEDYDDTDSYIVFSPSDSFLDDLWFFSDDDE